jgi:hypothetical protein
MDEAYKLNAEQKKPVTKRVHTLLFNLYKDEKLTKLIYDFRSQAVVTFEGIVTEKSPKQASEVLVVFCFLIWRVVTWGSSGCENTCFVNVPICYTVVIQ